MTRTLNDQLGKILLAAATVAVIVLNVLNQPLEIPIESVDRTSRQVMVELDRKTLATKSRETLFFRDPNGWDAPSDRFVFVEETKQQPYIPPTLDLPPTRIQRPARLVTDPGPSLEGTAKLPRFGEEFGSALPAGATTTPANAPGGSSAPPAGNPFTTSSGLTAPGFTRASAEANKPPPPPPEPVSPYKNPFIVEPAKEPAAPSKAAK